MIWVQYSLITLFGAANTWLLFALVSGLSREKERSLRLARELAKTRRELRRERSKLWIAGRPYPYLGDQVP